MSGLRVLFRIAASDQRKLERLVFQRHPGREWGTFFTFGFRRTHWGWALSYVDALPPGPGDLDRNSGVVQFRTQYISRAMRQLEDSSLGVGVTHSHPQGVGTFPSASDDDMDLYFGTDLFRGPGKGRPYCSLILNRTADGRLEFSGRVHAEGSWLTVRNLIIPGDCLERIESATMDDETTVSEPIHESVTARLESLIGEASKKRLEQAVVGVIGCSGTGSPAIEMLARAGVGELILVDPQRLSPSNLERVHGSKWNHVHSDKPPYKVECLTDLISEINPHCHVTAIVGNILHEQVQNELLRCDLLLGCSDSYHARAALGDLASFYLLPTLDAGVLMDGKHGQVALQTVELLKLSPDLPCPFCQQRIDPVALDEELITEEEKQRRQQAAHDALKRGDAPDNYWHGTPRQLHTVGYLTTTVGAMLSGYAIGWLTGAFRMPYDRFQFDIGKPNFAMTDATAPRRADCVCAKLKGHSHQAKADRSVTLPKHWSPPIFLSTMRALKA
jgi:hypothetical protein